MKRIVIIADKTEGTGGWRAAVYQSGWGAKPKEAFAETAVEALQNLVAMLHVPPLEQKCCDKCHDVYFDKTYPAHTAYDACVNLGCECHHIVQVDEMVAPPATEAWERAERTAWQKFACRNEIDDTGVLEAIDDAENYWIERLSTQASRILEELKVKIGGMKLEGFNDKHEVNHTLDAVIKMLKE